MYAQSHRSDPRILGRRTLERDHRGLAALLRPGMSVLDVGCGTGAITAGMARAIRPLGQAVGVDRDSLLLDLARTAHTSVPNLRFEPGDAAALPFRDQFDIVTAARTLQWIADPARAISKMTEAAKPAGMLVVLDYNHAANGWRPDPPQAFQEFYCAFLAWRDSCGWDNAMAQHLPELFRTTGLIGVESQGQDEIAERGQPDFGERSALWSEVIENVGAQIVTGGFCSETQLKEARDCYRSWADSELITQTLAMCTVTGIVPPKGTICSS